MDEYYFLKAMGWINAQIESVWGREGRLDENIFCKSIFMFKFIQNIFF